MDGGDLTSILNHYPEIAMTEHQVTRVSVEVRCSEQPDIDGAVGINGLGLFAQTSIYPS